MEKKEDLNPFSPEIVSNQATINIGTIGHVAHGKTTVVKAISGVHTIRHKNELIRNITIKLGYANAKIFECPKCPRPDRYSSSSSKGPNEVECKTPECNATCKLIRHVSFVDCPGHDILMATMLNGAAVMDAALLLIAGNETCPQPQTKEHLAAIDIMKLEHIAILQNKIDLVKKEKAKEQHNQIITFTSGTSAQNQPIIPISAQLKYNIDYVLDFIVNRIPMPVRNFKTNPRMIIIRSFDVNKPGSEVEELVGGVAGGSILQGILRVGDTIEIRPGIISRVGDNQFNCRPITSRIVSLKAEQNELQFAVPGGLIGVGTDIDPQLCRADRLVGQVLGAVGQLPDIYKDLQIEFCLLRRLLGVRTQDNKRGARVENLQRSENLMINVGSLSSNCKVEAVNENQARISLQNPVCTEVGEKISISRKIDKHWRLIGWGKIRKGSKIVPQTN